MKSEILAIRNMMHKGSKMEGKHLMQNHDWLLSQMRLLSLGELLDSSANSDSSPGWA